MRDDDMATFWKWLKYLWREERSWLTVYGVVSVLLATFIGLATFCLLISIQ
jgi:hypothetical protein